MTHNDKKDVISVCNILADKMSDSGKVAVQQIIGAVEDMVENEPCEDCISRYDLDDAISSLTYWHPTTDGKLEVGGAFEKTVYKVEDVWRLTEVLSPVTPKQKVGKWIVVREEYEFMGGVVNEPRGCKCSNCNKIVRFKSNYCPNCGADMAESED